MPTPWDFTVTFTIFIPAKIEQNSNFVSQWHFYNMLYNVIQISVFTDAILLTVQPFLALDAKCILYTDCYYSPF